MSEVQGVFKKKLLTNLHYHKMEECQSVTCVTDTNSRRYDCNNT